MSINLQVYQKQEINLLLAGLGSYLKMDPHWSMGRTFMNLHKKEAVGQSLVSISGVQQQ
jgi:hypothetical protein